MALVKKLVLSPDTKTLLSLGNGGVASLYRRNGQINNQWFIQVGGSFFRVFVDYEDVVFKFECFGLMLEKIENLTSADIFDCDSIGQMHDIQFFFRSEWSRSVSPSGVSVECKDVERIIGTFECIEEDAISACVSMVGMAWHSEDMHQIRLALFLDVDQDDPTEIIFLRDEEKIIHFANGCDVLCIKDVEQWNNKINTWAIA